MADFTVTNGDVVSITPDNWPDLITKLEIQDGSFNVANNTDEIKLLQFDKIYIKVFSLGKLNISGKLVPIATSDGSLGQEIELPFPDHTLGGVFIETAPDSGEYELWRCINAGAIDYQFSDFAANELTGRVFRIEDGKIKFTDTTDGSLVPAEGCKIFIPNIIMSTTDGDSNSSSVRFYTGLGGFISLNNVAISNVTMNLSDLTYLKMHYVTVKKPTYMNYCSNVNIKNSIFACDSTYSSGISIRYSNDMEINNLVSQSVKSYGFALSYCNNVTAKNIFGYLIKRDSGTDYAVMFDTVQNLVTDNINNVGGALKLNNINNTEIGVVNSSNTVNLQNSSNNSQPNVFLEGCSGIKLNKIKIPAGGGSYDSFLRVLNSSKIDMLSMEADDDYANYVVRCDVAYSCKFVNARFKGCRNSATVKMDNMSDDLLVQNFVSDSPRKYSINSKNTQVKGVYASEIVINNGAENTTLFEIYKDNEEGELLIHFTKNKTSNILNGEPKFEYGTGLHLKKGDIVEYKAPFSLRGITFKDQEPQIEGGNSDLRFLFKIKTAETETDYMLFNAEKLTSINNMIDGESFEFYLKIDASDLDDNVTLVLNKVKIATNDIRFAYPIYFKPITIMFDALLQSDPDATYALMYKDSYLNGEGYIVRDKNGNPIIGKVNGAEKLTFEYDYLYNDENGRTPNQPFDVVLVVTGKSIAEPVELLTTVSEDSDAVFNVISKADKAYALALELLNN